jgi:hypothetical protein
MLIILLTDSSPGSSRSKEIRQILPSLKEQTFYYVLHKSATKCLKTIYFPFFKNQDHAVIQKKLPHQLQISLREALPNSSVSLSAQQDIRRRHGLGTYNSQ